MVSLQRRASEASVPKPRLYHHFLRARITREQRQAIQAYAKRHGLRWGEAVRQLIAKALEREGQVSGGDVIRFKSGGGIQFVEDD